MPLIVYKYYVSSLSSQSSQPPTPPSDALTSTMRECPFQQFMFYDHFYYFSFFYSVINCGGGLMVSSNGSSNQYKVRTIIFIFMLMRSLIFITSSTTFQFGGHTFRRRPSLTALRPRFFGSKFLLISLSGYSFFPTYLTFSHFIKKTRINALNDKWKQK